MAAPIIPDQSIVGLRAMQEAGLRHFATRVSLEEIRLPNGEYEKVWVAHPPEVPCLFVVTDSRIAELAAAKGVQAIGVLKLKRGTEVDVGTRYSVRGIQKGREWVRVFEVTADMSEDTERIVRRTLVVEVDID